MGEGLSSARGSAWEGNSGEGSQQPTLPAAGEMGASVWNGGRGLGHWGHYVDVCIYSNLHILCI